MTPARPAPGHPQADLPTRLFRALFPGFDLRTAGGLHVAVPRGTLWYAGQSLGEVARQISTAPGPDPNPRPGGPGS